MLRDLGMISHAFFFVFFRSACYFGLLIVAKFLRCVGIFVIDILAKQIHVVGQLWLFRLT